MNFFEEEEEKVVVKKKKIEYESYLSLLSKRLRQAEKNESAEKFEIMSKVAEIEITTKEILKLSPNNLLFYLNYGKNFVGSEFCHFSKKNKETLYEKLLLVDLFTIRDRQELADFISWSCGSLFEDAKMAKLVKKLVKASTLNDSGILFELKSVVDTTNQYECQKVLAKGIYKIKNIKTLKLIYKNY